MHSLTVEEIQLLHSVNSFDELANVALSSLVRMKHKYAEIVQICGPMSTGGYGDFQRNMQRFSRSVEVALSHEIAVFNQVLFQEAVIRICNWREGDPYPMELLEIFYGKVLSSGYITKGLFLPGWESSLGACWERKFLLGLGITVEDYPPTWIDEIN